MLVCLKNKEMCLGIKMFVFNAIMKKQYAQGKTDNHRIVWEVLNFITNTMLSRIRANKERMNPKKYVFLRLPVPRSSPVAMTIPNAMYGNA